MKSKKLIIALGGDRTGNYETIAPIVNEITTNFNCDVFTITQSNLIRDQILSSLVLSEVFCKNGCISVRKDNLDVFRNLSYLFSLINKLIKYDSIYLITNRKDYSLKFSILYRILSIFSVKRFYTKSYSRSSLTHKRQLRKTPLSKKALQNYALIPTVGHTKEYSLIGYKQNQLIITGYPKFYPSWKSYLTNIINKNNHKYSDVLFIFTKDYSSLKNVIFEVLKTVVMYDSLSRIILKPHPTMPIEDITEIVNDLSLPKDKHIVISTENVAFLSFKTKVVISHATSAAYDAKIFNKHLINYYPHSKEFIDRYRNHYMDDMDNHEIMSSANSCDFISDDICYGVKDLKSALDRVSLITLENNNTLINKDTSSELKSLHKAFS
jgi:hypothetical protein